MKIRKATKKDAKIISLLRRDCIKKLNSKDYNKKVIDFLLEKNNFKGTQK